MKIKKKTLAPCETSSRHGARKIFPDASYLQSNHDLITGNRELNTQNLLIFGTKATIT